LTGWILHGSGTRLEGDRFAIWARGLLRRGLRSRAPVRCCGNRPQRGGALRGRVQRRGRRRRPCAPLASRPSARDRVAIDGVAHARPSHMVQVRVRAGGFAGAPLRPAATLTSKYGACL